LAERLSFDLTESSKLWPAFFASDDAAIDCIVGQDELGALVLELGLMAAPGALARRITPVA
jgi:hypothetical protein